MDDWDLEPQAKKSGPSGGRVPGGPVKRAEAPATEPARGTTAPGRVAIDGATPATATSVAAAPATTAPSAAATQQSAGATAQPSARPLRSKLTRLLPLIVGALVLLLVGALAGFFIARSQSQAAEDELAQARQGLAVLQKGQAEAEERNWNYYRENEALKAEIAALKAQPGTTEPGSTSTTVTDAAGTFTDGIYLVGDDITPGDYDGVVIGQAGYWARLRGTDGVVGAIVANGLVTGPFVLTINTSDVAVELRGVKLTSR
jgi:hypothetical protein